MSFKDDVRQDIRDVFENANEFMDVHTINGKEMPASVDDLELAHRDQKRGTVDGAYKKRILIYVSGETFGRLPAANAVLHMDKTTYVVREAHNESGMYAITLEVARS